MSKLKDFLDKSSIDTRRLLAASKALEALGPADRAARRARRVVKKGKPTDAEKATAETKPRSGRPVSAPTLGRALSGGEIPGAAKTRILRAVNHLLTAKKKGEASLSDLF